MKVKLFFTCYHSMYNIHREEDMKDLSYFVALGFEKSELKTTNFTKNNYDFYMIKEPVEGYIFIDIESLEHLLDIVKQVGEVVLNIGIDGVPIVEVYNITENDRRDICRDA